MKRKVKENNLPVPRTLRRRAEERLKAERVETFVPRSTLEGERLVVDLQIHEIELEMQNEELTRARLNAEESQAKYADLYDFAPVGYVTLDESGRITETNLAAVTLLGAQKARLIKRPLRSFVHPDFHDIFHLHVMQVLRWNEKRVCELVLRKEDGTFFHGQLESLPVQANRHRAIRIVIQDISARKKAEEELSRAKENLEQTVAERTQELSRTYERLAVEAEERRRLVTAIEQSAEGVLLIDEAGLKVEYANRAFLLLSGYERDEFVGSDVRILRSGEREESFYEFIRLDIEKGNTWTGDYPLKRKDGAVILVEKNISPIRDSSGKVVSRVVTCHEVTEKRQLEAQLRQAQKMEAIGTLAGGIAHDFNNILAAIIGFTEMALDDIPSTSPMQHHLELVLKSGFRGRDLVKQILAFSRKTDYQRAPLALEPLVKETLRLLRSSLPATIEIRTQIETIKDTVIASPSEIQQVIMNLCTNAAYAMRQSGGELTVALGEARIRPGSEADLKLPPGKYIELTVKDTGTGIDREVLKRIFEPFFTTKEVGQGTGLGLSVVYGIVKGLNGEVVVESTPGIGSAFRIFLPRGEEALVADEKHTARVKRGKKEHILFIDDEKILAELGKSHLERLGYEVTAMTDGMKAVRLFSKNPQQFNLVFTDMTMPEMTGLDVARSLIEKRPDIPIILCTGYSDDISPEKAAAMGIKGFLMKPLSRAELATSLRRVLDKKQKE
ncbi:MAG TPA: PAS domain S-box protein [Syntrophorhabdaceae bacterium]|jgi:PAS domain S-box-containing protein